MISVSALVCAVFPPVHDTTAEIRHAIIYCTLFFIGAIFLLATLFVYAMLPELRRAVQGLSLMAHSACMLIAYIGLIIVKADGQNLSDVPCLLIGKFAPSPFKLHYSNQF